jgi:acetolactate synthase I/II/III large subunit
MIMTIAELLIRCLEHEEVRFIFGVPGEETLDITGALLDSSIQFIPTRHEQGAAFMAACPGKPGFVFPHWVLVQPTSSLV